MTAATLIPDLAAVRAAAQRLQGVAMRTPLLQNAVLDARVGGRVLIKPELLQRTGSFKFRGAYNRLVQLSPEERAAGVVAWSSGNHAQGVAAAANILGIHARIVMPADAPRIKIERTRGYGADVVTYDRFRESREEIGTALAAKTGAVIVPPYDDPHIVAGQGTVGLEIAEDAAPLGAMPDVVLVPASGGGFVAGVALAFSASPESPSIYCVEPEGFDDHRRSLIEGARVTNATGGAATICDALMAPKPGEITFAVNRRLLAGGLAVSDTEVEAAMRFAFEELKLVVEPGGAVALAALLSGKIDTRGKTVALVLSGGNVDPVFFARVIAAD